MNMYLRSGEIQVSPFDWSSFRNISESMIVAQVKKLASKSSTVAIRDEIAQKVMKSSITQMKDNISRNIEKSMLVVEHVKLLRVIDNSPDLDRNMTLWRENI
jgi:hypothetical protein